MWHVSGVKWTLENGLPKHHYHVKYAESADGVQWKRTGVVCIDFASADEYAIGRPHVLKDSDGVYRMWYSYRGDRYRIGYAESADGIAWDRKDDLAGIERSPAGWDADMIEYPMVFDTAGRRYMLSTETAMAVGHRPYRPQMTHMSVATLTMRFIFTMTCSRPRNGISGSIP